MGKSNIPTSKQNGLGLEKSLGPVLATVKEEVESLQAQAAVSISEETITVDDTTQEVSLSVFNTKAETENAASVASLADGTIPGQRKLITLATQGTGGDQLTLDGTNIHNLSAVQSTGVVFDAEGEFLLVEWTGSEWQEVYASATVNTA